MKTAQKIVPVRFSPDKHRALVAMLEESDTNLQKFVDEVTSAALAQHEAHKRFLAAQRRGLPPEQAVALLHRLQKRAHKARLKAA